MFDKCSCTVAIGGDIRSVVAKSMVTPAEIMLLQSTVSYTHLRAHET